MHFSLGNKFFAALFTITLLHQPLLKPRTPSVYYVERKTSVHPLALAAGVGLGLLVGYCIGRGSSWCLQTSALQHYVYELDLLAKANGHNTLITDRLMAHILEKHNDSFWLSHDPYKNYPILKYKLNLDWYINMLWLLSWFHYGTQTSQEITELRERLKQIRSVIVQDYRLIGEQRKFDKEQREISKNK